MIDLEGLELNDTEQPGGPVSEKWVETIDSVRIDFNYREEIFRPGLVEVPAPNELIQLRHQIDSEDLGESFAVVLTDVFGREFRTTGPWPTALG